MSFSYRKILPASQNHNHHNNIIGIHKMVCLTLFQEKIIAFPAKEKTIPGFVLLTEITWHNPWLFLISPTSGYTNAVWILWVVNGAFKGVLMSHRYPSESTCHYLRTVWLLTISLNYFASHFYYLEKIIIVPRVVFKSK